MEFHKARINLLFATNVPQRYINAARKPCLQANFYFHLAKKQEFRFSTLSFEAYCSHPREKPIICRVNFLMRKIASPSRQDAFSLEKIYFSSVDKHFFSREKVFSPTCESYFLERKYAFLYQQNTSSYEKKHLPSSMEYFFF